ncbi:hypothetical protein OOJ91_34235 [Micromonospora lupini]|uniref:hypothetical protein n=1 Tax=Micromonospora lupini TaxID=285679 RepID=UPI00225AD192|nr:hypothetical protein [Micromonospora lupini]MCX5070909.1 hypothetical protein [Micromonospora lupini]
MNVSTQQIHRHLIDNFHGTDVADEIAAVCVTLHDQGYAVRGFATTGARDRVARIIRAAFDAESDTMTGRVVAEGTTVHVQIGPASTPQPAPFSTAEQAEAVATLGALAETFVRAAGAGDDQAAERAALRTVDQVLHHLPAGSAWTRATRIAPGFYPSRMNGSACLVGDQLGEPRQLTAHHEGPGAVIVAGVRITNPDDLEGLGRHLQEMAERMRAG